MNTFISVALIALGVSSGPGALAQTSSKYPACNIAKGKEIHFRNGKERDLLQVSIKGAPCYQATLKIVIRTKEGLLLYSYEAAFKPHIAVNWEHIEVPKDPASFIDRLFKHGSISSRDLPALSDPGAEYRLEIDEKSYERLRKENKPVFRHPVHYEEGRYVIYDEKTKKPLVVLTDAL
jgi:hypothetical protein